MLFLLALSLSFPFRLNAPRQVHDPKPVATMHWYMSADGHAVKCSGRPYLVYLPLRVAVDGCAGPNPQIILKD